MGMQPNVIKKDFWVCFMLDYLFHNCKYKNAFVFKGGTSLSKSYHVIKRFSEDIDLVFDWRKIINDEVNPWEERSKTKQDLFNKQINSEAEGWEEPIIKESFDPDRTSLTLTFTEKQAIKASDKKQAIRSRR